MHPVAARSTQMTILAVREADSLGHDFHRAQPLRVMMVVMPSAVTF
jgi:hypothetical protein